ncbi:hypothetical protein BDK51DRAFT_38751 [Blyttiomyces helicus]|uniref:Uncharacterized protein n=1 Tax=Blyttiomyces helicus TaxID=388810 RepID=A0A4P9WB94_9FUNG|nr:hypothetical protein BDK51DRAFT_38751 [Blyttiomyces helicus]|eukprot:RKO87546.1 hypothetical protein BDK51DRAFT_38751 [Blyttiomyces helicus]
MFIGVPERKVTCPPPQPARRAPKPANLVEGPPLLPWKITATDNVEKNNATNAKANYPWRDGSPGHALDLEGSYMKSTEKNQKDIKRRPQLLRIKKTTKRTKIEDEDDETRWQVSLNLTSIMLNHFNFTFGAIHTNGRAACFEELMILPGSRRHEVALPLGFLDKSRSQLPAMKTIPRSKARGALTLSLPARSLSATRASSLYCPTRTRPTYKKGKGSRGARSPMLTATSAWIVFLILRHIDADWHLRSCQYELEIGGQFKAKAKPPPGIGAPPEQNLVLVRRVHDAN